MDLDTLPEADRRILTVLSVMYGEQDWEALHDVLRHLGWKDSRGRLLAQRVVPWDPVDAVTERLLLRSPSTVQLADREVESLLTETAARDGSLRAILSAIQMNNVPSRYGFYYDTLRVSQRTAAGEARALLYLGDTSALLNQLGSYRDAPARHIGPATWAAPLKVCFARPDPGWLARIDPRILIITAAVWISECHRSLGAWGAERQGLAEDLLMPLAKAHPDARNVLAELALLRGDFTRAEMLLGERMDCAALELRIWLSFKDGGYSQAARWAGKARKEARRLIAARKLHVPGVPGLMGVLAGLLSGKSSDRKNALAELKFVLDGNAHEPLRAAFDSIDALVQGEAGGPAPAQQGHCEEPVPELFSCLTAYWLGEEVAAAVVAKLRALRDTAAREGWGWYAGEADALLARLEVPSIGVPRDWAPLCDAVARKSRWERTLDALTSLPDHASADDPYWGDARRLVWLMTLREDGSLSFGAASQKRASSGEWRRAQDLDLINLVSGNRRIPYMRRIDEEICSCFEVVRELDVFGQWALRVQCKDWHALMVKLIGHPGVLSSLDDTIGIKIERGTPVLSVERHGDAIRVSMIPRSGRGNRSTWVNFGPRLVSVYEFSPGQMKILELLGRNGLQVPAHGEGRLLDALARIARMVTVHSEISGDDAASTPMIAGDARPHLYLTPRHLGLAVRLVTKPLGEGRVEFVPGAGSEILFCELDGETVRCRRDLDAELAQAYHVRDACPDLCDAEDAWSWETDDPVSVLTVLEALHAMGEAVVLHWPQGTRIEVTRLTGPESVRARIYRHNDWLQVDAEVEVAKDVRLGLEEALRRAATTGGRYVQLDENRYVAISAALRQRLEALQGLTDGGRFHPAASAAIAEATEGMHLAAESAWTEALSRVAEAQRYAPEIPERFVGHLRDYQVVGFTWAMRLAYWGAGAALCDDMGLGKTVTCAAILLARSELGPALVIAPATVTDNWIDELAQFAPSLNVMLFGRGDRAAMLGTLGTRDVVIASYGMLPTEGERLSGISWATAVADEAQLIKNSWTKRSRTMMRVRAGFRMLLTGTPIENRLMELWNLFRFINPGLLGSQKRFQTRYAAAIEGARDKNAETRLNRLIAPFVLRRMKSDVAQELPACTEMVRWVELSAEERALYETIRGDALQRLEGSGETDAGKRHIQILAELTKLRLACCHPRLLLPPDDPSSVLPSSKLTVLSELLDEVLSGGHKVLVFSQFVRHLDIVRTHLQDRGIRHQYLGGSTPQAKRRASRNSFQEGDGDVFLISIRAGGIGVNLTAADVVLLIDPMWNPWVEDQARDRAHRIGQTQPISLYRLIAKGTIEEKMLKLHATKREMAEGILAGTDTVTQLDSEELLALISDGEVGE